MGSDFLSAGNGIKDMIGKFVVCKANSVGKTEYWNGTSSGANAWSTNPNGAKPFDTEDSAMVAFCDNKKFNGKVSKIFADASAPACRLQGSIEVSIQQITVNTTKKFTISPGRNFPS
jgi:hypothetical protein